MMLPFFLLCAIFCIEISCRSDIPISMETLPRVIDEAFSMVERHNLLSNDDVESSSFCFDIGVGNDSDDDHDATNTDVCDENESDDELFNTKEDEITDEEEIYGSCSSDDKDVSICSNTPLTTDSCPIQSDCSVHCDSLVYPFNEGIGILFVLIHR